LVVNLEIIIDSLIKLPLVPFLVLFDSIVIHFSE